MRLYRGTGGTMPENMQEAGHGLSWDTTRIEWWTDSREVAKLYGPVVLERDYEPPIDATMVDCKGLTKDYPHMRTAMLDGYKRLRDGLDPMAPIVMLDIIDTPNGLGDKIRPHITVGFKKPCALEAAKRDLESVNAVRV